MRSSETLSIAAVILDQMLDHSLDYLIPLNLLETLEVGMRVKVPVKNTMRLATVFEIKKTSPFPDLKPIAELLGEKPFISPELSLWPDGSPAIIAVLCAKS